jgi:hypothetical protein
MPLGHLSPLMSPRLATTAALGSAAAVAVLDLVTPFNYVVSILYGIPLSFAAITRNRRLLISLLVAAWVLTFLPSITGRPVSVPGVESIALTNRSLAAVMLLAVALALLSWIDDERVVDSQRAALSEQNRELEAINEELGQREEEIVRQNEELQSQTEELERQGEELRVTNDELASREKTLEQLLELSRSLTAELSHGDMLKKICEALGVLTTGLASAVCEKRDDHVHIICDHGFGPGGPANTDYTYSGSFNARGKSRGPTA